MEGYRLVTICGSLLLVASAEGLWPLPRHMTPGDSMVTLNPPNLVLQVSPEPCNDTLHAMFVRVQQLLRLPLATTDPELRILRRLVVEIGDPESCQRAPGPLEDESYSLEVKGSQCVINATTLWGALHGLTTFAQLPYLDRYTRHYRLNETEIHDRPVFSHRGLLLDTSKHFVSLEVIKHYLVGMSLNKLNVLHWKIVGDHSWPFQTSTFPELAIMGAHTPFHVYTAEQVTEVTYFAHSLGIRVVPEFNVPGGMAALSSSHPEWTVTCGDGKTLLHPATSLNFLKHVFGEWKTIFNSSQFHVGLSGFNQSCWEAISGLHADSNGTLMEHFVHSTLRSLRDHRLDPIVWGDAVAANISMDPEVIVEIGIRNTPWQTLMTSALSQGHSTLMSACWHLAPPYSGQKLWKDFYSCFTNYTSEKGNNTVLGGEVTYCSCLVDGTNLISTVWPAASAMAERLWTNPEETVSMEDVAERLREQRCRMVKQGLPIPPLEEGGFLCEEEWLADQTEVSMEVWQQWQKDRTPTPTPTTVLPDTTSSAPDVTSEGGGDSGKIVEPTSTPSKSESPILLPSVISVMIGLLFLPLR